MIGLRSGVKLKLKSQFLKDNISIIKNILNIKKTYHINQNTITNISNIFLIFIFNYF